MSVKSPTFHIKQSKISKFPTECFDHNIRVGSLLEERFVNIHRCRLYLFSATARARSAIHSPQKTANLLGDISSTISSSKSLSSRSPSSFSSTANWRGLFLPVLLTKPITLSNREYIKLNPQCVLPKHWGIPKNIRIYRKPTNVIKIIFHMYKICYIHVCLFGKLSIIE